MLLDSSLCDFDWKAPTFTLKTPQDESVSFSDALGPKGLLIAFISNHCPYVKAIAPRLAKDADLLLEDGIGVLAIMPNDYQRFPEDAPHAMSRFAKQYGFNFPYLIDQDQLVATAYGAVCTPDFFGLNGQGKLQYRGRLDDLRNQTGGVRTPELLNAMRQVAETGRGPQEQHASMGCSIKWRTN